MSRLDGLLRGLAALTAVLVATVALVGSGLFLGSASAVALDGAIKDVTISPAEPELGEDVKLNLDWAVPKGARGGDTFSMDLPDELNRITKSFRLKNPAGAVVANAVVADGRVTFTLTDYVETHDNVRGTAYFWAEVSSDLDPGKPYTLVFDTSNKVTITPKPAGDKVGVTKRDKPFKGAYWADEDGSVSRAQGDLLSWNVSSPAAPAGGSDTVTVDDRVGAGHAIVCDTTGPLAVRVTMTDEFDENGQLVGRAPVSADKFTIGSCSPERLKVTVRDLPEGALYTVRYYTRVTDTELSEYTNGAQVTMNGTAQDTTSTVRRSGAGGDGNGDDQTPMIDIEKWSTEDGPKDGDFDDKAKPLAAKAPEAISFTVTNNGTEPLVDVKVQDSTVAGTGDVRGLTCDFSKLGGPATGTGWDGPFAPGATFECEGTLEALGASATHTDTATVNAVGQHSKKPVDDADDWNGETPEEPVTPSETPTPEPSGTPGGDSSTPTESTDASGVLPNTGMGPLLAAALAAGAALTLGGVVLLVRRRAA